ncbi:MAG: UbiD family decarboxylase [Planctomycetota bacterium]|nr:UbiD family decarboxylase [Planctomycetota bacterium]
MSYKSLKACVDDLARNGHLVRIAEEVDPCLEMAEIQRRLYAAGGPAVLFERVRNTAFPAVANLFGTPERCRFLFRHTLERVRKILQIKADPAAAIRHPLTFASAPLTAWRSLPKKVRGGAVLEQTASISDLPAIKSWPDDGGPFITLPQVYTEDPRQPKALTSNLGMYRVQLSGNDYENNREVGLHYQIHRGIGVHHAAAIEKGEPLKVSIFVGGPPAHTLAAVMPMPEGLSELIFAGMLAGRRFRLARRNGYAISADADFCIVGTIEPGAAKPEGPFGDHLGYYSLQHDFPVLKVEGVYHRRDAIWPFTVVGRPPQEDTSFGALIHELTAPLVPQEIPGLHAMHAVDAAGVHPLMLAVGSERYVPYDERQPRELLTTANALLGFSQASLAKYLFIAAQEDDAALDASDIENFLRHVFERVDFERDLHFQTRTTIDTLDYSGTGLNTGSKLVHSAAGEKKRELDTALPAGLNLPGGFDDPRLALPGVLVVRAPAGGGGEDARDFAAHLAEAGISGGIALVVLTEDSEFCARNTRNFLWVTFTRSNPSHDLHGAGSFIEHKHWGCKGPIVIDARIKPHHAPPLIEDAAVSKRVDELASKGGPLHGII